MITPYVSSQIPKWFFHLTSDPVLEQISAGCSTLEGVFYRCIESIRETSYGRIDEIQAIFNGANALLVLFYAKRFVNEIQGTFAWSFGTLPVMMTAGSAFVIGVLLVDQLHQHTINSGMTLNQKIAKALHVTKLVLNVALACFVKNRFWFALSLAGSLYSLISDCTHPVRSEDATLPRAWDMTVFETLHAQYSVVRAGITYLQQYPELATTIEKASSLVGVIDFLWLGGTCYYLCQKIEKKREDLPAAIALSMFVALVLSGVGVYPLNNYFRSNALLKALLVQISPTLAQSSSIRWVSRFELAQIISLARLITSTALSFFSTQRITSLVNLSAQTFNFVSLSPSSTIELTSVISPPLDKITSSVLDRWKWESLKIRSTFVLSPSCASNGDHLKSSLQAVSGYVNGLFDQGRWELLRNNGYLTMKVFVKQTPLPACGCTLPIVLDSISMKASLKEFLNRISNVDRWKKHKLFVEMVLCTGQKYIS